MPYPLGGPVQSKPVSQPLPLGLVQKGVYDPFDSEIQGEVAGASGIAPLPLWVPRKAQTTSSCLQLDVNEESRAASAPVSLRGTPSKRAQR